VFNVGCGEDLSIRDLTELIREVVEFQGKLMFDASKPAGTPRKLLDVSRMKELGWKSSISLRDGLTSVYKSYLSDSTTAKEKRGGRALYRAC
jgi:GDP-L-fucose synthase